MNSYILMSETDAQNIADAIRSKTGNSEKISSTTFL